MGLGSDKIYEDAIHFSSFEEVHSFWSAKVCPRTIYFYLFRPNMRGHRKAGHHSQVYDEDLDEDVVITLTAKNPQESAIPFNVFARD